MIVITHLRTTPRYVLPEDEFQLTISDDMGCEVIIREVVTKKKTIDYIATFRFALEDGTCPGFHLMGVFACQAELPQEFREAKQLHELTKEQYNNFCASVGVEVKRRKRWYEGWLK